MKIPQQYRFLVRIGRALHIYGVPSYKTQMYLDKLAKHQGVKASFMDLPTWVNYVFYEEDDQTYNYIEDISPGSWNLGGFSKTVAVANKVLENKIDIDEAHTELDEIKEVSNRNTDLVTILGFGLSALSFSMLFRTNWFSVLIAFLVGCIVGTFHVLARRSEYISSILESLIGFVSTFIIGALASIFPDLNIMITIISAIIVYVPGLAIATALEEIASRNLVSGTAKFFDSLISLFKQFLGIALALATLFTFTEVEFITTSRTIPLFCTYLAVPLLGLSFVPIFRIRNKDIACALFVCVLGYVSILILEPFGALISTFIGAIIVMLTSKFIAQKTRTPKLVYSTMGILMLVPGSKTFIGLHSAFYFNGADPSRIGEQIGFILMGIIGGIMFSGAFIKRV